MGAERRVRRRGFIIGEDRTYTRYSYSRRRREASPRIFSGTERSGPVDYLNRDVITLVCCTFVKGG